VCVCVCVCVVVGCLCIYLFVRDCSRKGYFNCYPDLHLCCHDDDSVTSLLTSYMTTIRITVCNNWLSLNDIYWWLRDPFDLVIIMTMLPAPTTNTVIVPPPPLLLLPLLLLLWCSPRHNRQHSPHYRGHSPGITGTRQRGIEGYLLSLWSSDHQSSLPMPGNVWSASRVGHWLDGHWPSWSQTWLLAALYVMTFRMSSSRSLSIWLTP